MMSDYKTAVAALSGIQNHWPLETDATDTITSFTDPIGSNAAVASTAPTHATGPDGSAIVCMNNKVNGRVLIPGSNVNMPVTHTIGYWIKLTSQSAADMMSFEWAQASFARYVQHDVGYTGTVSGGHGAAKDLLFSAFYAGVGGATAEFEERADWPNDRWVFVCETMDESIGAARQMRIYKNAVLASAANPGGTQQTGIAGAGTLGIMGRGQGGRGLPLDGAMCGVFIVNGILSTTQMAALRAAMLSGAPAPTTPQLETTDTQANSFTVANGVAINIAKPTNLAAGDIVLIIIESDTALRTFTPPSGFIHGPDSGANNYSYSYYKIATGSEPATYDFMPNFGFTGSYIAMRISGSSGVDVSGATNITFGDNPAVAAALTTTQANELLVLSINSLTSSGSQATPTGMRDAQTKITSRSTFNVFDEARPTAGSTGTRSSSSGTGSVYREAFMYSFKFAPSGLIPPTTGLLWPRGWKTTAAPANGQLFPRRVIQ